MVSRPLNILGNKETKFQQLKQLLIDTPIFTYSDPNKQRLLDTDARSSTVSRPGAVLSQVVDGKEVVYYSKTFNPLQKNYCVTQKQLLAVVPAVSHFRP